MFVVVQVVGRIQVKKNWLLFSFFGCLRPQIIEVLVCLGSGVVSFFEGRWRYQGSFRVSAVG